MTLVRPLYVVAGVIVAAIIAGAVGVYFLSQPSIPPGPSIIKIGAMEELTGPFAAWAVPHLEGMKFAVKRVNDAGGVLGRPIELVVADSKADPKEAVTIFRKMVEVDQVVAIVGPVSSDVAIATTKEAERLKVPLILHMAGSEKILTKSSQYTFRTTLMAAPMNVEAISALIKDKGYIRVGAIVADYAWGHAIKGALESYVSPLPGVRLPIEVAPVRETDFTSYLRKIQPLNPQIMVISGHPPGLTAIVKQMFELGMNPEISVGPGLTFSAWYKALGKDAFRGITDWGFYDPNHPDFIKLAAEFRKATGQAIDRTSLAGYLHVQMLVEAMKKANSLEPVKIRDAVSTLNFKTSYMAYPFSYTPWGELKEARMVFVQFKPGPPSGEVDPTAEWHTEAIFTSPPLKPYEPTG